MTSSRFSANGKLLLTGEYSVLEGALALAVPIRFGQQLEYRAGGKNLSWESYDAENNCWFRATFSQNGDIISSLDLEKGTFLQKILIQSIELTANPLPTGLIKTHLDFPNNWGLGSSSTLIYLISQWLDINAMKLFFNTMSGSGYDVACAGEKQAILYQLKGKTETNWDTTDLSKILKQCYFIYLNQKKLSAAEVLRSSKDKIEPSLIKKVSELSKQFTVVESLDELASFIEEHENITATVNRLQPVKQRLFPDYDGAVKSLGAWGGDFIMALGNNTPEYFRQKGYPTLFKFDNITLNKSISST